MSKKEIEDYLAIQTSKVQKSCSIVEANDENQGIMLHISPENMSRKPYAPWIGPRQANQEDRTVPRVTVSDSILGCIYGYAAMLDNVFDNKKAGWYIHQLEFEHCLKPGKAMVYDADLTNEHWLVRYNEATSQYKGKVIGKLVAESILLKTGDKNKSRAIVTLLAAVEKCPIKLTSKQTLEIGYYRFKIDYERVMIKADDLEVTSISQAEFEKGKKYSCGSALESMQLPCVNW